MDTKRRSCTFVRQKVIKRRCWPDPSDAAARRDTQRATQTAVVEAADEGRANGEASPQDVGGARHRSRRVEDASTTTQRAQLGWQEPPRKVARSSSRALGVQEALSALLWQPYECRQESSVSSWLDDSEESTGEWPAEGSSIISPALLFLVNDLDSLEEHRHQGSSCWSRSSRPIEALVSRQHSGEHEAALFSITTTSPSGDAVLSDSATDQEEARMVNECHQHGSECCCGLNEASGVSSVHVVRCAAVDMEDETEDEERRLCSSTVQPRIMSDTSNVSSVQIVSCNNNNNNNGAERTYTSTEAQTDATGDNNVVSETRNNNNNNNNREQRRRERRERRQQRHRNNANNQPPVVAAEIWGSSPSTQQLLENGVALTSADRLLPDLLLNSHHLPPPYSTLPIRGVAPPPPAPPPGLVPLVAAPPPLLAATGPGSPPPHPGQPLAMRFSFPITPNTRRCRGGGSGRGSHLSEEPKSCCGVALTQAASIRWFIVLIAFVGVCCAVVGTVLGAMKASGREHLTISLLMIGVGIVLVMVSGVGWRLTAHDAPSCRAMLGLGGSSGAGGALAGDGDGAEPNRRFVPRLPPSYGRPHHPYAAMIYPEFQYRPPPPSYQASMQEYRLRLLLLDRGGGVGSSGQPGLGIASPSGGPTATVSPPPTYRSQVGSMLRAPMLFRRDHSNTAAPGESSTCSSRPPSYRSRAGSTRPASVTATGAEPGLRAESRRASLLMLAGCSSSPGTPPPSRHSTTPQPVCDVSVICVGGDSPKIAPPPPASTAGSEKASLVEEPSGARLVTIVQTGDMSPTSESGVTTVTVSGLLASGSSCNDTLVFTHQTATEGEMEILAHL